MPVHDFSDQHGDWHEASVYTIYSIYSISFPLIILDISNASFVLGCFAVLFSESSG